MAGRIDRSRGMGISSGWVPGDPATDPQNRVLPRGTPISTIQSPADPAASIATPSELVRIAPASDSIAGQNIITGGPQWTPLANYRTGNGAPRKGTVIVAPQQIQGVFTPTSFSTVMGVYVRITYGTDRGHVQQIVGAPCEFPVEGSYVYVEGRLSDVPYKLGLAAAIPNEPASVDFLCRVTSMVVDGWTSPGPSIILASNVPCGGVNGQLRLAGVTGGLPAIIDTILLTNTNASDTIAMAVMDAADGNLSQTAFTATVPAASSMTIGAAMLGPYFTGVSIRSSAGDPLETNVLATIWGRYLLRGGGAS